MFRLLKSFKYAFRGLKKVFSEEQNLRIEGISAIIIITLAFVFKIKTSEWCLIFLVIFLVILMEILNSAVERVADILKPRIHNYVKEIKDIMAGGVLMSSVLAIIIGLIIFIPYIADLLYK